MRRLILCIAKIRERMLMKTGLKYGCDTQDCERQYLNPIVATLTQNTGLLISRMEIVLSPWIKTGI
jgi:hypothetical protein